MMNPLSAGSLDANAKRKTTLFARRPEERTRPGPSFPCICLLLNIYTTLVKFVQPDRSWHFAHLAYEIWGGPNQQYPAVFVCVSYDFVASHCMYKCGLLPNNFVNEKLFVYTHLYILGYFSSVFDRNNGCSLYIFFVCVGFGWSVVLASRLFNALIFDVCANMRHGTSMSYAGVHRHLCFMYVAI